MSRTIVALKEMLPCHGSLLPPMLITGVSERAPVYLKLYSYPSLLACLLLMMAHVLDLCACLRLLALILHAHRGQPRQKTRGWHAPALINVIINRQIGYYMIRMQHRTIRSVTGPRPTFPAQLVAKARGPTFGLPYTSKIEVSPGPLDYQCQCGKGCCKACDTYGGVSFKGKLPSMYGKVTTTTPGPAGEFHNGT